MKQKFTILIAALMLLAMITQPTRLWGQTYKKVTSAPSGTATWDGEYILVYENSGDAYCWTGVDEASCYASAPISSGTVSKPSSAVSLTIASMTGGYSIRVNGGNNNGKYTSNNGSNNGIKFNQNAVANTLTYENSATTISCGNKKFRYNKDKNNWRFRYFGSEQQKVQLYKKAYTVTYNANGGSGTMTDSNSPYFMNTDVITLYNDFSNDGKSFTSWNTKADGSGSSYAEGDNFTITENTTLYAQWASATVVSTPSISLDGGTYTGNQSVTISCATDGASIYYTLNGTDPTASSTHYIGAITIDHSCTLKAKAFKDGLTDSEVASATYTIKMETPSFSPAGGTYDATQSVSLSSTAGATIYYTLDGSTPTTSSTVYSSAISVSSTKTIKALAVKANCNNSDIGSAIYTLKAQTPTFSPAAGTYLGTQTVSINCATADVTIYYTTNGDTPTTNSSVYSSAISVSSSQTLKAIAVKSGLENSSVGSAEYTINHPLTTMDAIFEASASAGSYYVTFNNWVVTGVNGNQVFVTDGTKGFIIYKSGHDFSVGNIISGTTTNATALTRFKGSAEFTALTSSTSDLTVTTGGTVTPQVVTIGDLSGVNTGSVITLNGLTYNSTDGVLSDGDHTITPYTSLYTGTFTNGTIYNITGVYQQYGDDEPHNILPRSSADIVEVHDPAITTSPATSLSVPDYIKGTPESGIDTEILTVNGTYLTADVTVALENGASSDFEMSTDLETWGHSITLNQSNGSVTNAEIAVRLKVGESVADYSDRIVLSSTNATTKYVNVTGSVTYAHVTYNGNGDGVTDVPTDTRNYTYNASVTVLGEGSKARTGYDFVKWNTKSDGTGDEYEEGGTFNITEDVTLFAQWTAKSYNITADPAITHGSISFTVGGETATSAQTGQTVTIVSTPDSGYGLSSVSVNSGAVTVTNNTFTMPASNVTVSATFVPTVTDVLTPTSIGVYSSTYTGWTNKTWSSEAVYAGKTSGGDNNASRIQLRTSGSDCGIITTTSGGKIKKIKVIWDSGSGTLDVYGRNSAYSAATNLYNTSYDGTKLGSINYKNSSSGAELEINNDTVTYIGLRSNSGTIYISQIEITWAAPTHALAYDKNDSEASGTMSDPNSPYIYNASVTVLAKANTITAPSGKMFSKWNAKSDGTGKDYAPGDTLKMPKHDKTLYAIWEDECNETATMAATLGAKEYVNNAGELSFKINLSSKVTALSSCAEITEYGFVYSTNGTTPTVGGANCTKIVKGTEYTTANTVFEHELTGATLGATYKICSYATNLAGTAYGTMATVEIDADYPSYTISYSTNGTAEGSTTKIYQGNAISDLIEPTPANVPAGYSFRGWYGDDYALNNSAPTFVKNGDAISGNLALKAVFAIGTTAPEDVEHNMIFTEMAIASGSGYHTGTSAENNIDVSFTDCLRSGGYIQMKATSGEIHNTKAIGNYITKIEIDANKNASNVTVFEGSNSSSITTSITKKDDVYTFSGNTQFFKVGNNGTYTVVKIKVYYNQTEDVTTYSNYCTSVTDITENEYIDNEGKLTEDITISSGALSIESPVTIPRGKTLTVEGTAVLVSNDPSNLIIEDGGQLICNNAVEATVHKTIAAWDEGSTNGWYFIASPINVNNLAPTNVTNMISDENAANGDRTYDLYSLDNITWHNYRANTFNLANGQGYLYASKDGADLQFSGAIKAYDANYTISVSQGWNLIGNPYTFEAYPNQAYYTINAANSGITAQTSTSSAVVAPCTGIIVKAAEDGTVKFLKDAPETSANNGNLQMVLAHKVATRDGASVNKNIDNTIVSFNEGSQLEKFYFGNPSASIFIPQNGEDYAIAFSDRQGDVPLYFKANETGTYTISFAGVETNLNGIHLIDILAEEEIDLSANPSYTFIGSPADRMARFKIVFRNTGGDGTSDIFAYQNGNDIIVSGEGELQIFDVMGRMVSRQRVNGVETVNAMPYGVYIFKLNGMTQKIVVR